MKMSKVIMKMVGLIMVVICLVPAATVAQKGSTLSDAEIASVAVVANQIDIEYAAIATKKSKSSSIIEFAETMARDHKAIIAQAVSLVTKLGVTPKDNAVSRQLIADAEKTKKMLLSKSAKTFDRSYIANEVTYHKAVIAAVEGLLIPESENNELRALLQNVVPALKAHLMHAEMVQKQINGSK